MGKTAKKVLQRARVRRSIRKKINGTPARPRLSVFRSNKGIYAQIIDDTTGNTIVSHSSNTKGSEVSGNKVTQSKTVGTEIAKKASEKGINTVVFDRGGYKYHGRVKALAEGAREAGLKL